MRAREFVTEYKTSREEFEGMTIEMTKNGHVLVINALDDWGNNVLGHVAFNIGDDNDLDPQELEVDERYQGQGIARVMYDYAKSKGYTIHRSYDQTPAGRGFWNKHRGEDVRVWEGVAEDSAEAYKEHLIKTMPQMMKFLSNNVKGWRPSEEQMLSAIDTAYMVMKHTGDVKQAGKSLQDELNTLHRMSQGQQGVAEAFNRPYKTKTEKSDYGDVDMLARLPDGTNLSIMFNHEGDNEWQVEFYRDNSQEVTGQGDAQRIFATVLASIQKFVKKYQPDVIKFSAEKSDDSDSRSSLYNRLVARFAQQLGYTDYSEEYMGTTMYELSKQSQGMAEQQLDELSFLGSECTKDCSGHRAGYEWSKRKGLRQANSLYSPSFNKGAALAVAGK